MLTPRTHLHTLIMDFISFTDNKTRNIIHFSVTYISGFSGTKQLSTKRRFCKEVSNQPIIIIGTNFKVNTFQRLYTMTTHKLL